ncbi:site-specific integrase, partial [Roseobacter sp. HKCCD7390]
VNMFASWYRDLGLLGCSSHSGRRTFITNAAKKITDVGGSLRDVQYLAGHTSLHTTERYIDYSTVARASQRLTDWSMSRFQAVLKPSLRAGLVQHRADVNLGLR